MRLILTVGLFIALAGCARVDSPTMRHPKIRDGYKVVEIDGCQYIVIENDPGTNFATFAITHKGDCANPIHEYREESAKSR